MLNAIRVPSRLFRLALLAVPVAAFGAAAPSSCWFVDAASPAPKLVYVLCEQGQAYKTSDGGANWVMGQTGATETLHALAFTSPTHGIAVGDAGTILVTDDGAKTWKPSPSGTTEHLLAIFAVGNRVWASGFDGTILRSEDAGRSWRKQPSNSSQALEGIFFADPDHGWAVGWSGTILRTTNGGTSWDEIKTDAASWSLASVYFKDLNEGWAVGFSGELLRSHDGGLTWKKLESPVPNWLTSVAGDRNGRLWAAADDQLLLSEDGGEKWRSVETIDTLFLRKLLPVDGSLWAMGQLGMLTQGANGKDWNRLASLIPAGADIPAMPSIE